MQTKADMLFKAMDYCGGCILEIYVISRTQELQINLPDVTHIVTEFESRDQLLRCLKLEEKDLLGNCEILSMTWFTASMKAGQPVEVEEKHRILSEKYLENQGCDASTSNQESPSMGEWACQRVTCLQHHNLRFTTALEMVQLHAELRDGDQDYSRALAFRRASCVLKSLPFTVTSLSQINHLKDLGGHCKKIIQEILDDGYSEEVEKIKKDDWFQKMKLFTAVFGIGPSTAKKWIERGWSRVEDARKEIHTFSDWRVQWGEETILKKELVKIKKCTMKSRVIRLELSQLEQQFHTLLTARRIKPDSVALSLFAHGLAFHDDLITEVTRHEADHILSLVTQEIEEICPGAIVGLAGGFRRGKPNGHDVDLLITHPDEGKEKALLGRLLKRLENQDKILCGNLERSSFTEEAMVKDFKISVRGQLDHFEKWLGIIKIEKEYNQNSEQKSNKDKSPNMCLPEKLSNKFMDDGTVARPIPLQYETTAEESTDQIDTLPGKRTLEESLDLLPSTKRSKGNPEVASPCKIADSERSWLARRVDLIVAPFSQYYYALVGWTGSKQYNRDLRLYATKKLDMKLTSHGLYDHTKNGSVPASSEKEVFENLKLDYREPWERNC